MSIIFQSKQLAKTYGKHTALKPMDVTIKRGEIYGLVGPNGAGKTTLMKLICGLITPTSGSFSLFGQEAQLESSRSRIGVLVETPDFFPYLSGKDNLNYFRIQRGFPDSKLPERMLDLVDLPKDKKPFRAYSLGMKQRLGLALSLMGSPEFLILDEPINGIDPEGIVEIRRLLLRLSREQHTSILISSHILTELAHLATRFGILHEGALIEELSAEALHAKSQSHIRLRCDAHERALAILEEAFGFTQFSVNSDGELRLFEGFEQRPAIIKALVQEGIAIDELAMDHKSLEDYYLSLIGGQSHV